ncbi:MAG: hypothetical protein F6K30_07415 [Cyanothece sp. SIO2G6]|nr:hypothetical protein [Cyanothece sp. SIO2G6]
MLEKWGVGLIWPIASASLQVLRTCLSLSLQSPSILDMAPSPHPHQQSTTPTSCSPPRNRLVSRPFTAAHRQVDRVPKALQSRPFFDPWTQQTRMPTVQPHPDEQERQRLSQLLDLTKLDLFAGSRNPSAVPPTPSLQQSEAVSSPETEVEEEQDEIADDTMQRKGVASAAEDGGDDENTIQAKVAIGQPNDPYREPAQAQSLVQRQDAGEGHTSDVGEKAISDTKYQAGQTTFDPESQQVRLNADQEKAQATGDTRKQELPAPSGSDAIETIEDLLSKINEIVTQIGMNHGDAIFPRAALFVGITEAVIPGASRGLNMLHGEALMNQLRSSPYYATGNALGTASGLLLGIANLANLNRVMRVLDLAGDGEDLLAAIEAIQNGDYRGLASIIGQRLGGEWLGRRGSGDVGGTDRLGINSDDLDLDPSASIDPRSHSIDISSYRNVPVTYGRNHLQKFRKHIEQIRRHAEQLGFPIGDNVTRNLETQENIRNFIDHIVQNGETRQIRWGSEYPDAVWSRLGDAIVIRQANGEFVTFLEAGRRGAVRWDDPP